MKDRIQPAILRIIEDATVRGSGIHVSTLVAHAKNPAVRIGGLAPSETTIRKAVNELAAGGFIRRVQHATTQWEAVSKHEQESDMPEKAAGATKKATPKKKAAPAKAAAGRPRSADAAARDEKTLAAVKASGKTGITVDDVAKKLGVERGLAYVSVWRLAKAGTIVKTNNGTRTPAYIAA